MSTTLRPLQLPLLVEERKRREEYDPYYCYESSYTLRSQDTASSPASPVPSTFSTRGHVRGSSSASSFDLITPATPDGPSSPAQPSHKLSKPILADVQEEPLELEEESDFEEDDEFDDASSDQFDLYDCLRNTSCDNTDAEREQYATSIFSESREEIDYDMNCLSDSDFHTSLQANKAHRGSDPPSFTNFSYRFNTRLSSSLSKWKSPKQASLPNSPVSDFSFDRNARCSQGASSRSSSLSNSARHASMDRAAEPRLPPTPALSHYESRDSVTLCGTYEDASIEELRASLQKQRALATTPLLPPMMMDPSPTVATVQQSPLESPTVETTSPQPQSPQIRSPALSAKPSLTSFVPLTGSSEFPPIPKQDAWSEQLGHANFTIVPEPYKPEYANPATLESFRKEWESARVNYMRHLARTGEHYGDTSKTYSLTEAKWADIERTWSALHEEIAGAVSATGAHAPSKSFDEGVLATLPRMGTEGKFPERGDQDIVGPMVREPTMCSAADSNNKRPSIWRRFTNPLRK